MCVCVNKCAATFTSCGFHSITVIICYHILSAVIKHIICCELLFRRNGFNDCSLLYHCMSSIVRVINIHLLLFMTFYHILSLVLFILSAVLLYGFQIIFTFNFRLINMCRLSPTG